MIDLKKIQVIALKCGLQYGPLMGMYGFFVFAVLGFAAYRYYWIEVEVVPPQPIAFSHYKHMTDPMGPKINDCMKCHQWIEKGPQAGAPPLSVCMSCHTQTAVDKPEIKKLTAHFDEKRPVHWNRVNILYSHVYFSHKRHIKAFQKMGITERKQQCYFCHGPSWMMDANRQVRTFEMGFCVSCHRKKGAPTDCWTCHK